MSKNNFAPHSQTYQHAMLRGCVLTHDYTF